VAFVLLGGFNLFATLALFTYASIYPAVIPTVGGLLV
jgi:hypothetical protein